MNVLVYGSTDKRFLIYPMLKMFQKLGDTCLITNDKRYKRICDDVGDIGHFQNIMVVISDEITDEIFEEIGLTRAYFDNIIFDTDEYIPSDMDFSYYIKSIQESDEEYSTRDLISTPKRELQLLYGKYKPIEKEPEPHDIVNVDDKGKKIKKNDKPTTKVTKFEDTKFESSLKITIDDIAYAEYIESCKVFPPSVNAKINNMLIDDLYRGLAINKQSLLKLLQGGWKE